MNVHYTAAHFGHGIDVNLETLLIQSSQKIEMITQSKNEQKCCAAARQNYQFKHIAGSQTLVHKTSHRDGTNFQ
jgi:hypothetical protein